MKCSLAISMLLATSTHAVYADDIPKNSQPVTTGSAIHSTSMPHADFCFIAGVPPSDIHYSKIKKIALGKGSYGEVRQILDNFADKASSLGADAIINYTGSQRFGFWPWRMVHPVVRGLAIKWALPRPDCNAIGGSTLEQIVTSNKGPTA